MGTLVAMIHEEKRKQAARGRELPCLKRPTCTRKWGGCERACGGYAPNLKGRR